MRAEYRALRRVPRVNNWSTAKSVGMIFRCDDEEKLEVVKKYIRHLKEEEGIKKIKALGFVDDKTLPAYASPKLELDFFCRTDLSWNFRPGGTTVKNFCNENWDILIDLESEEIIPLRHILNRSGAKFKVGYFTETYKHYYDLMLDVKSQDVVDYIAQVNYYLSIINKVS